MSDAEDGCDGIEDSDSVVAVVVVADMADAY